jgi:hypothetical protein
MDTNTIIQIISSLGFPIVMCGALFWFLVKQLEHLKDTINENTKMLAKLTTLINILTNEK